jgi:hypothetical protein
MTTKVAGLSIVSCNDINAHKTLAPRVQGVREFWPDENMDVNPGVWYVSQFCNPLNLIFDIEDGRGMIAFLYTVPSYRSQVFVAKWDETCEIDVETWRSAAQIAVMTHDLICIDAFIGRDNVAAQKLAERAGMRRRGIVRGQVHYKGEPVDTYWYEIDRAELGIEGKE